MRVFTLGGKPVKTKVVAGSAILILFCCNAVWAQWPNQTYGTRPVWEMEIGARVMDRPGTMQDISLITEDVTLDTVFDAEQASDLNVSGGIDFRVQRLVNDGATWEIRGYFNNWDVTESRTGNLMSPAFTPPGLPANSQLTAFDYFYESNLFSLEWNFKRAVHPGFSLFLGPRYMYLQEQSLIEGNFFNPGLGNFLQTDTPTVARNNLWGLGLGAEFRRPLTRDLFLTGFIKGGVFYNDAKASINFTQTVFGTPVGTQTLLDDRKGTTAGVGELSIRLHYDIAPGTVSIYAGYEAVWVDGVATAPAQILTISGPAVPLIVDTGTTIFSNGMVAGGMVRF